MEICLKWIALWAGFPIFRKDVKAQHVSLMDVSMHLAAEKKKKKKRIGYGSSATYPHAPLCL